MKMTDLTTPATLKMSGDFSQLTGETRQSVRDENNKTKDYIVIKEEDVDFDNLLFIFKKKKEDLPVIKSRMYAKSFIKKNIGKIQEAYSLFLPAMDKESEDYKEYKAFIDDLVNNCEEDWDLEDLEFFSKYCTQFDHNSKKIKFPDVETFDDFENAYSYKDEHVFIFQDKGTYNVPAYCFDFFDKFEKRSYFSNVCLAKDVWKHFDSAKHYDMWFEEIEEMERLGEKGTEEEPTVIFAFG